MAKQKQSWFNKKDEQGNIVPKSRPDIPGVSNGAGGRAAKCDACKEIFSTPGNFDSHRKTVGYADNYNRICVNPESVDLVLGERDVWISAREFGSEDMSS